MLTCEVVCAQLHYNQQYINGKEKCSGKNLVGRNI